MVVLTPTDASLLVERIRDECMKCYVNCDGVMFGERRAIIDGRGEPDIEVTVVIDSETDTHFKIRTPHDKDFYIIQENVLSLLDCWLSVHSSK